MAANDIPTSLRIPGELRARIEALAEALGESQHALMLRLMSERLEDMERHRQFLAEAEAAAARTRESRFAYDAREFGAYLSERMAGKQSRRPRRIKV
jgi:predicted DNA-binding protein